jgi:signal transduction histidine kinase
MAPLLATCVPPASALRFDLAADLPLLDFACGAMGQIVMNLVKNAAVALGDQPGAVTVSTGWIELHETHLREQQWDFALLPGRHVCLAVADSGCGIDDETISRLLQGSFTSKTNGHGLGLASVRRIAAAHRASVLIDSQLGAGTTVRVVFAVGSPAA